MVAVEGGTFTMGATSEQGSDAEEDEIIRRISDGDPRRVYIKRW